MLKRIFVILSLILLGSIAAYIVYLEDMRYSLPTPVPTNYEMIPLGTFISPPSPILTEINLYSFIFLTHTVLALVLIWNILKN